MSSVGAITVADLQCLDVSRSVLIEESLAWVWIPVVWLSPLLLSSVDECATIRPLEEIAVVELWWGERWTGQTWFGRSFPLLSLGAMSGATLVLLLLPIDCVKGVLIQQPAKKSDASCTCVVSREDQCGQKPVDAWVAGKEERCEQFER